MPQDDPQVIEMLTKLSRGIGAAFEEMNRRLQAVEEHNTELILQNKTQQRLIEKFLQSPDFLAKQDLEVHERAYRTAGLRVFLTYFPLMWSDDSLKAAYRKVIVNAGHTKNPELISALASRLWKWAANLRSNLLKTKGPSHFLKAVGSLGSGRPQDISNGDRDEEILLILAKYFREASVTDLPDDFNELITDKIQHWRIPFVEAASKINMNMGEVIQQWKEEASSSESSSEEAGGSNRDKSPSQNYDFLADHHTSQSNKRARMD